MSRTKKKKKKKKKRLETKDEIERKTIERDWNEPLKMCGHVCKSDDGGHFVSWVYFWRIRGKDIAIASMGLMAYAMATHTQLVSFFFFWCCRLQLSSLDMCVCVRVLGDK